MRKRVLVILICLVVGVVVNVLVAWAVPPLAGSSWRGGVDEPVTMAPRLWPAEYRFGVPIKVERRRGTHPGWTIREVFVANISRAEADAIFLRGWNKDDPLIGIVRVFDIGLPMRGLRMIDVGTAGKDAFAEVKAWSAAAGVQRGWIVRTRSPFQSMTAALPLVPLWPGFLVNTLVYGAMLWGLLFVPGMVKRMRRRKRGACVGCGYDLRGGVKGGVCPECGRREEKTKSQKG